MRRRLIYLLLIVKPGDTDALERLMVELKRLKDNTGGRDEHRNEPSRN